MFCLWAFILLALTLASPCQTCRPQSRAVFLRKYMKIYQVNVPLDVEHKDRFNPFN